MNIFVWILFGIIAGSFAHLIDEEKARGGYVGSILWGIAGALTGGLMANLLFGNFVSFDLPSFIIAICGSLMLLFIHRMAFSNPK